MSTTLATTPSQLCFPWMQTEKLKSHTNPTKRARTSKNTSTSQLLVQGSPASSSVESTPVVALIATTSFAEPGVCEVKVGTTSSAAAANTVATVASACNMKLPNGARVGQVRIGNVMLSLLKKYGITDQEISDVLSRIAQENCQGLAS